MEIIHEASNIPSEFQTKARAPSHETTASMMFCSGCKEAFIVLNLRDEFLLVRKCTEGGKRNTIRNVVNFMLKPFLWHLLSNVQSGCYGAAYKKPQSSLTEESGLFEF